MAQLVPSLVETFQDEYGREPRILVYHFNNYIHSLLSAEIYQTLAAARPHASDHQRLFERIVQIHTLTTLSARLNRSNSLIAAPTAPPKDYQITNEERAAELRTLLKHRDGLFDIVLVDEGQDVSEQEFDLLTDLCRLTEDGAGRSRYVFYDDLQNIFGTQKRVRERLHNAAYTEHFLSRCVRTSKLIMDFTLNTCISPDTDTITNNAMKESLSVPVLLKEGLLAVTQHGNREWLDSQFCVFPGEVLPDVQHFTTNSKCIAAVCEETTSLRNTSDATATEMSILILCFNNNLVKEVSDALIARLGPEYVRRRSGRDIRSNEKRNSLAVEKGLINVALIHDAKGYDADVVFILNPDGTGSKSEMEKRKNFYVAATRAKQFLAIYSAIPMKNATLIQNANKALSVMQSMS